MTEKVLVVDDNQPIRELLAEFLKRLEYGTCAPYDGLEALKVFQREQSDLLITDVVMPHSDGFELPWKIRAISKIPIVTLP